MPRTITIQTSTIRKGLILLMVLALGAFGAFGVNAALGTNEPNVIVTTIEDSVSPIAPEVSTLPINDSVVPVEPVITQQLGNDLVILGLDHLAWTDAYSAASNLETSAQQIMNAVFLIREGSIEEVAFNPDQLDALQNQGLAGMVLAVDRYTDLLGILEINQSFIDTWEISNPQGTTCYTTYLGVNCPPLATATPTP